ncbi:MAG: lipid-A-disaccharide synthase, partial [Candidatus Rokuibacteriota bacterium]
MTRRPDVAPAIMLAAGEASGDAHGATLCRALADQAPGARLVGMGGPRMAQAGMELLVDVTSAAAAGGTEAIGRVPTLLRAWRRMRAALEARPRPDVLVLIDFPEFNLRLARVARRAGVPVVYFVPPQIWAWRGGRVRTIRRRISLVLAAFPFEAALYRSAGVPVEFVGHPAIDALVGAPSRDDARRRFGLPERAPVVGLLPGSRYLEVERMLPAMRDAAVRIHARHADVRFVLALAPTIERAVVERLSAGGPRIAVVADGAHAVMRAADVLLVTSGTATLEAALLGTPMVVGYRLSRLSELMVRFLIRVPWVSLANIALGRAVVPELYQGLATGEVLAREGLRLLESPAEADAQRTAFAELTGALGEPGVGARAARLVL